MNKYTYILAALAIGAASTLASAQSVTIEGAGSRDGVRRDGADIQINGERDRSAVRGQLREGDGDRHERMGARAELNRNPYSGRSMRRGHDERVVIVKHRRHHHRHDM